MCVNTRSRTAKYHNREACSITITKEKYAYKVEYKYLTKTLRKIAPVHDKVILKQNVTL